MSKEHFLIQYPDASTQQQTSVSRSATLGKKAFMLVFWPPRHAREAVQFEGPCQIMKWMSSWHKISTTLIEICASLSLGTHVERFHTFFHVFLLSNPFLTHNSEGLIIFLCHALVAMQVLLESLGKTSQTSSQVFILIEANRISSISVIASLENDVVMSRMTFRLS